MEPLTAALRRRLHLENRRTRHSAKMLLAGREDVPAGLDARTINRWQLGTVREAPAEHLAYVLVLYAALPGADAVGGGIAKKGRRAAPLEGGWISVTPTMQVELKTALHRAGVTLPQLLREWDSVPAGMTVTTIRRWRDGQTRTANPDWWRALMRRLAELPDAEPDAVALLPPHTKAGRFSYRPIPADQLVALRHHHRRTGITGEKLLKDAAGKPPDLNGTMIAAWISGATRSADPDHLTYVLALYADRLSRE
jgi:hypothetical protein